MSTSTSDTVLILGGRSDIGQAIAHRFAKAGHPIVLAARSVESLKDEQSDMALRHQVQVDLAEFDVLDTPAMAGFVAGLDPAPGIVVCVVGAMGVQSESEENTEASAKVMRANYEGPSLIMGLFANQMLAAGKGTLVGISSVAGDRGRATNYVYGSAKAGFTAFLSGLRNRLASRNVHVMTVKPGFVATQMTADMDLPKPLTAEPEQVAEAIYTGVQKGRNILYVKPVWWLVMKIICNIPERIFKKMSL